jgi:8-oxo-dGTP pyrophosphatase MutT (NUDIX family)
MSESLGVTAGHGPERLDPQAAACSGGPAFHALQDFVLAKGARGLSNEKPPRPIVKAHRRMAANSVFEIFFDHLIEPPDREVADFLVVQPKNMEPGGISGICVLPVVGDKFALVDCYRHPLGQMSLEAPKGFIDAGETPPQAAMRELAEETGLSCSAADLIRLGTVAPEPGIINGRVGLFVALNCSGVLRVDPAEIGMSSVRLLSQAELESEIGAERILDAVTLLLVCRYRTFHGT